MPIPPRNKKQPDDGGFETLTRPDAAFDAASNGASEEASAEASGAASEDGPAKSGRRGASQGLSLKARAVGYLSRREHARDELARKLRPYAEDPDEVQAVLDALQREGWQSNERFAQSLVHRRAPLRGTARIVQELKQHGLDDVVVAEARARLKATELDRARAVWAKRYDAKPADRNDYARQARFLAGRGFSPDTIRRILGESGDDMDAS